MNTANSNQEEARQLVTPERTNHSSIDTPNAGSVHQLMQVIWDTACSLMSTLEAELGELDLSYAKLLALETLVEAGGAMTLSKLAGAVHCTKANISQLVDRMEREGLVAREAGKEDRRSIVATLTEKGNSKAIEGDRIRRNMEKRYLGQLDAATTEQIISALHSIPK